MRRARFSAFILLAVSSCLTYAPASSAAELSTLIARAEQHNAGYRASRAAAESIRHGIGVSRSGLLPSVTFYARAGGNSQDIDVAPGAVGLNGRQSFDSRTYEIKASQPLFRWDRWLQLRQANRRLAQAEAEVAAAHGQLVIEVVSRYFDVLRARVAVALSEADIKTLTTRRDLLETQYKQGVVIEALVFQAQAELDLAQADLVGAQSNEAIALSALTEYVGEESYVSSHLATEVSLPNLLPADPISWKHDAEMQNPQYLAAKTAVEVAKFDRKIATAGHLPTVDLVGRYGHDSQGGRFGETDVDGKSIGIEVEVPIFQGGATFAQRRVARARVDEIKARADAELHALRRDTAETYHRVIASLATAKAAAKAVESASVARRAIEAQYDAGTRTLSELRGRRARSVDCETQAHRCATCVFDAAGSPVHRVGEHEPR